MFRVVLGTNILAPISPTPTNILDVGTGSGAWPVEVAKEFPFAAVRGLDIAPVTRVIYPPNCQYIIANMKDRLPFEDECMDLVNSRYAPDVNSLTSLGRSFHHFPKANGLLI